MSNSSVAGKVQFWGTGRRKTSTARVRLLPGDGKVIINNKELTEYFTVERFKNVVIEPLVVAGIQNKYDVVCTVKGGGISGQAGAVKLGIARALIKVSFEYRPALKRSKCLTRDPRKKERKKYGLKKARKAPQFSKR